MTDFKLSRAAAGLSPADRGLWTVDCGLWTACTLGFRPAVLHTGPHDNQRPSPLSFPGRFLSLPGLAGAGFRPTQLIAARPLEARQRPGPDPPALDLVLRAGRARLLVRRKRPARRPRLVQAHRRHEGLSRDLSRRLPRRAQGPRKRQKAVSRRGSPRLRLRDDHPRRQALDRLERSRLVLHGPSHPNQPAGHLRIRRGPV